MHKLLGCLLIFLLLSMGSLSAQLNTASLIEWQSSKPAFQFSSLLLQSNRLLVGPSLPSISQYGPQNALAPKIYSYQSLSPFCKLDVQLDKVAPLNIRFRLGEVEYVDRLEGKGPTRTDYRR